MRSVGRRLRQVQQNPGSAAWASQALETQAGKVLNMKVVVQKGTKIAEIRYCEQLTPSNAFLLKFFNFSCHLCERLTSHVWTAFACCEQCERLFHTRMEARGVCYDCCTQI